MLWTVGPFFLFAMCAASFRILSKAAYKKGLNEYAFGLLGVVATLLAGSLGYLSGAALDPSNGDIAGLFFGGLFFLPMEALYVGAIYGVIKFCPADGGEMLHHAVGQQAAGRQGWQGSAGNHEAAE